MSTYAEIEGIDSTAKDLIGFSLTNKINHGLVGAAWRATVRREDLDQDGIDALNDALSEFDQQLAGNKFLENAGRPTLDPMAVASKWLAVYGHMEELGWNMPPVRDALAFRLENAMSGGTTSEEQAKLLEKASGVPAAVIQSHMIGNKARLVEWMKKSLLETAGTLGHLSPDEDTDALYDDVVTMIHGSFASARKAVVKTANDVEKALGELAILKEAEKSVGTFGNARTMSEHLANHPEDVADEEIDEDPEDEGLTGDDMEILNATQTVVAE